MSKPSWKIISPAKAEANKANAQASTGPRTDSGKASSAANAATHGLTSKRAVLRGEDPTAFNQFHRDFEACLKPVGEQERTAFEEYVLGLWRLQRCRRTETAVLDDCIQSVLEESPELTPDEALARVFTDPAYQKKMSLFLRYQSGVERAVNRAFKELTALQSARREAEAMAAEATPPPVFARPQPSYDDIAIADLATPVASFGNSEMAMRL